ncbi:Rhomboid family protein [Halothece sp. PCC 7418]|uniref:rhomboid family intramembrane serine protease n=1 Tax=Halothece sp. (strain PCC 7418) TaxID=65093 RepID=UPI0002A08C17|nr:rhomboid family intramembrane serine protease [Halothece sp. PCC 7418]AFZ44789.1 Rhomboid family protein [Halothece sp. PCC 7418]
MTASEKIRELSQLNLDQVTQSAKHPQKELEKIIKQIESLLAHLKTKIAEQQEQQKLYQEELNHVLASLGDSSVQSYEDTALERKDQFTLEKIRKAKQLKLEQKQNLERQLKVIKENIDLFYRDRNVLEEQLSQARSRYQPFIKKRKQPYCFHSWLKILKNWKLPLSNSPKRGLTNQTFPDHPSANKNNGLFALLAINFIIFILDHTISLQFFDTFYLDHDDVAWYQLITSMFCHANWQHLSSNLFFLYLFGKLVEEEEGVMGIVGSYLICGLGANLMSLMFQPSYVVSLGASGAVFGLFTVSVLLKLGWHWRRLLEVIILGQFVLQRVLFELQNLDRVDGINRIAHLGGALMGVILILGLKRWQERTQSEDS